MPLPRDRAWFPAKNYGWGWGYPRRWQGWVVMMAWLAALLGGAPLVHRRPIYYVVYVLALGALLTLICWWKGERPRWRWGGE